MNLMKCPNGHHYDASRFSSCPFCGMEGVNVGPDQAKAHGSARQPQHETSPALYAGETVWVDRKFGGQRL